MPPLRLLAGREPGRLGGGACRAGTVGAATPGAATPGAGHAGAAATAGDPGSSRPYDPAEAVLWSGRCDPAGVVRGGGWIRRQAREMIFWSISALRSGGWQSTVSRSKIWT